MSSQQENTTAKLRLHDGRAEGRSSSLSALEWLAPKPLHVTVKTPSEADCLPALAIFGAFLHDRLVGRASPSQTSSRTSLTVLRCLRNQHGLLSTTGPSKCSPSKARILSSPTLSISTTIMVCPASVSFPPTQLTGLRYFPLYSLLDARFLHACVHLSRLICIPQPHLPARAGAPTGRTHSLQVFSWPALSFHILREPAYGSW